MTKSMFGMAIAIIVMSLIVLLLPMFFAHADEPRSHLFKDERCGNALPDLWWGTEIKDIQHPLEFKENIESEDENLKDVGVYIWKPNYSPLFHDYGKTQAHAKSFELWFRDKKLCAVRAEFTGGQFQKMLPILAAKFKWDHTWSHQKPGERWVEFVYVSCKTKVIALRVKLGEKERYLITWYYTPLCEGLIKED